MSFQIYRRLSFIVFPLIIFSCEKNSKTNNTNSGVEDVVLIDNVPYELVSNVNISSSSDSSNWKWSTGGELYVDNTSQKGDSTVLYISAIDGCFFAEQKTGASFLLKQESVIQFSYQLPKTNFNDERTGNGYTCAGACRMEIFQGETLLLSEWIREVEVWTDVQFFFRTKLSEEVKIRFIVGSRKGFWLDDIKLLQKL